MPDIYFTCKACGKCLVADDGLTGLATHCSDCSADVIIPTIVIVQPCPHCGQKLKFTADLKGEVVDCTSCNGEVAFPGGTDAVHRERLVDYTCPRCNADIETLEGKRDELTICPGCGAEVRLRRKLHLRMGSDLTPSSPGSEPSPPDAQSGKLDTAKRRGRVGLASLLRYAVVDLILLSLMCIPLPALNGHNFFYALRVSLSGSQLGTADQKGSAPTDSRATEPVRSEAWNSGHRVGQTYGKMDRDSATYEHRDPNVVFRSRFDAGYSRGTTDYSDFWDGYRQGYVEIR